MNNIFFSLKKKIYYANIFRDLENTHHSTTYNRALVADWQMLRGPGGFGLWKGIIGVKGQHNGATGLQTWLQTTQTSPLLCSGSHQALARLAPAKAHGAMSQHLSPPRH